MVLHSLRPSFVHVLPSVHTSFHAPPLPAHIVSWPSTTCTVPPSTSPLRTIIPSQDLPYLAELAHQRRQIGAPPSTPIRRLSFAHLPPTNPKRRIGAPPRAPPSNQSEASDWRTSLHSGHKTDGDNQRTIQPRAPTSASVRTDIVPSGPHHSLSRSRTHSYKSTRESASLFTAFTSFITIFGPRAPTPGMNRSFPLASRSFLLGVLVAI
jgi:hypothetical protein